MGNLLTVQAITLKIAQLTALARYVVPTNNLAAAAPAASLPFRSHQTGAHTQWLMLPAN